MNMFAISFMLGEWEANTFMLGDKQDSIYGRSLNILAGVCRIKNYII